MLAKEIEHVRDRLHGMGRIQRMRRVGAYKSRPVSCLEQMQPHVMKRGTQGEHQRKRTVAFAGPRVANCVAQGAILDACRDRRRNHGAFHPRRKGRRKLLKELLLCFAPRQLFSALGILRAKDGLPPAFVFPFFNQVGITDGFNLLAIIVQRHMGKACAMYFKKALVVSMIVRRSEDLPAQAAARHADEVSCRRIHLPVFAREPRFQMNRHRVRHKRRLVREDNAALLALEDRRRIGLISPRLNLHLNKIVLGIGKEPVRQLHQRICPPRIAQVAHDKAECVPLRNKTHNHRRAHFRFGPRFFATPERTTPFSSGRPRPLWPIPRRPRGTPAVGRTAWRTARTPASAPIALKTLGPPLKMRVRIAIRHLPRPLRYEIEVEGYIRLRVLVLVFRIHGVFQGVTPNFSNDWKIVTSFFQSLEART
jgi:hypothetical protein